MPDEKSPPDFIPAEPVAEPTPLDELELGDSAADAVISANLAAQTREILATLTPREEQILRLRFGIGENTADEVGQDFEVTRERIREIEAKALRSLRGRGADADDHDDHDDE